MTAGTAQDTPAQRGTLGRLYRPPLVGLVALVVVMLALPLTHSLSMVARRLADFVDPALVYLPMGLLALALLVYGIRQRSEVAGTLIGFATGMLAWTGWAAYAFRFNEISLGLPMPVLADETRWPSNLLFIQGSIGICIVTLLFFALNRDTRCNAFRWIQRVTRYDAGKPATAADRNFARITFLEVLYVIWFCYAVSLFLVDTRFVGSHHPMTYVAGFGFIAWTFYLLMRLARFTRVLAGVRYAIPTAGIFWTAVEFAHEWGLYDEFWSKPQEYALEMGMVLGAFVLALLLAVIMPARRASGARPQA